MIKNNKNRLLSRGGIVEEDGRRWTKKKFKKSQNKKGQKNCLESAWDGLGTLVGVQIAQKNILGTRSRLFRKKLS